VTRRFGWALGGIVLAAAALRVFRLDHFSYGLDEILQGYMIQGDWKSFWGSLKFDAVHPPLDYLIARGVEAFGPPDWARKLPAVFWGVGTVAVLGVLMSRRAGKAAGLFTALLLAFAPFHIRYSQEFRPYSLGLFLLCAALLCLDRFVEKPSAFRLAALYLACLATAYALYLAALVLALAAAAMLVEDSFSEDPVCRRAARRFLAASPLFGLALFLAYLPWWPVVLEAARRPAMAPRPHLTAERFGRILSFFAFTAGNGRPPDIADAAFLLVVALGVGSAIRIPRLRFLCAWAAVGFAATELLGQLHPHYDTPNHYLPAGIAAVPLAGVFVSSARRRLRSTLLAAAVLTTVVLLDSSALRAYFREGRADWRPLARFLRSRSNSERVFTENQYSQLCVAFYLDGPLWLRSAGRSGRDVWNLEGEIVRLTWSWPPGKTAWLVLAGEPRHAPLRQWAAAFPSRSFPSAEGALLHRLDPDLRENAFAPAR
jgi:4-amino-4-deoxy-L-arabinose transferase-like glycosyltransferase